MVLLNPGQKWEQWFQGALQAELPLCKLHAAALDPVNC